MFRNFKCIYSYFWHVSLVFDLSSSGLHVMVEYFLKDCFPRFDICISVQWCFVVVNWSFCFNGFTKSAEKRMNTGDGCLAKDNQNCIHEINWNGSRIVSQERDPDKRKFCEAIETEQSIYKNMFLCNEHKM